MTQQVKIRDLYWSGPWPPNARIRYDHFVAQTPIGEFSIEWKSWKTDPDYSLNLNSVEQATFHSVDEAKAGAANIIRDVVKCLVTDSGL